MFGIFEQGFGVGFLDDTTQIHDSHPGGDVFDHGEIMADEHVGQSQFAAQIP